MLYRRRHVDRMGSRRRCVGAVIATVDVLIGLCTLGVGIGLASPLLVIIGTLMVTMGSIGVLLAVLSQ